jgi:DNA-binding transcriptional regulator YhcF (GntR family)
VACRLCGIDAVKKPDRERSGFLTDRIVECLLQQEFRAEQQVPDIKQVVPQNKRKGGTMPTYLEKLELIDLTPELGWKAQKVWAIIKAQIVEAWRAGRKYTTPKNQTLADMAGCHKRTVQRTVHKLEASGLLEVTERFLVVGKQAIQISNQLTVALTSARERFMLIGRQRDKLVTQLRSFYSGKYLPSKRLQAILHSRDS